MSDLDQVKADGMRMVFEMKRDMVQRAGLDEHTTALVLMAFGAEAALGARGPITEPSQLAVTMQQVMAAGFYHPEWLAAWVTRFPTEHMKGLADEMVANMPFVLGAAS